MGLVYWGMMAVSAGEDVTGRAHQGEQTWTQQYANDRSHPPLIHPAIVPAVVEAITAPALLASEGAHSIMPQAARTLPSGALLGSHDVHDRPPLPRMLDEVHLAVDPRVQGGLREALQVRAVSTGGPAAGPPTVALAPIAARSAPKAVRAVAKAQLGKRVRRTAEDLEKVEAILDALRKSPGLTSEGIQEAAGMSKPEIQKPLEDQRNAKRVKTKGQRRGMQHYAK